MLSVIIFLIFFLIAHYDTARQPIKNRCGPNELCIDIWKCPYYVKLLHESKTPRPPHVIGQIRTNLCGFVDRDTPKVCCNKIFKPNDNLAKHRNYRLFDVDNCGRITDGFRVTQGRQAFLGEFPWMALLVYATDVGPDFRCGGTIINANYILTAAHCVENSTKLLGVRLGEYDTGLEKDCDLQRRLCNGPVQDFLVDEILPHPLYDPATFVNDVALVRLAIAVNLTTNENISPVCLPFDQNVVQDEAVVTGWGVTETGEKSRILLKVVLKLWTHEKCQKVYGDRKPITRNQICAGGQGGRDSCAGDSGGPLQDVHKIGGAMRYVQQGIVSYGPRFCGLDGRPGIYTKVREYLEWILDNIKD